MRLKWSAWSLYLELSPGSFYKSLAVQLLAIESRQRPNNPRRECWNWQTSWSQKPVALIGRAGSSPVSRTAAVSTAPIANPGEMGYDFLDARD